MSCLTQHKTKEELSNWLMENASDNETTGFLDMLAGDIWSMMTAEEKLEEEKSGREHDVQQFQSVLDEKGQLEAEVEELQEENKKLKKEHIQNIMKLNSIAKELYREMKYSLGYGEFDEPDRKVMYDDIKRLKQKATAWDIINGVDWEHLRDLCDKEMCKDLIACGECVEGDFEGYECYEEEEE
jgi:predicted nuclease with TOPRIM domain